MKKINKLKGKTIDRDFNLAFKKALKGDYSLVKNYNKKAKDFQKKYNVDTPIIRLGENLNPKNFVAEFDKYSPGAQKNIMQVAKEKGIVIETKSSPLFSIAQKQEKGKKKLTALQELSQRAGSGVDPILAARAAKEEFVESCSKSWI